jgi:hypothetical protein
MNKDSSHLAVAESGGVQARELLELAGKAVGMRVLKDGEDWPRENVGWFFNQVGNHPPALYDRATMTRDMWRPLTDDGDALRLAVRLGALVGTYAHYSTVDLLTPNERIETITVWHHETGGDALAATRLAIVRAAAAIAKATGQQGSEA